MRIELRGLLRETKTRVVKNDLVELDDVTGQTPSGLVSSSL